MIIEELGNEYRSVMNDSIRHSGIDIIGDAPWGTHFCLFYQTTEDLIDILIPYFKTGLGNNEFCMWVTSQPLEVEDAKEALRKVFPEIDVYLEKGQLEIVSYSHWYVKDGIFDSDRVLNGWVEKLNQALANGYDGLRLTGNTFWLEKEDRNDFVDYEKTVDSVIGNYQMIALCAYNLDRCNANEIIDVVVNHQFALIKKKGKWERIESSKRKEAEKTAILQSSRLREKQTKLETALASMTDAVFISDVHGNFIDFNEAFVTFHKFKNKDECYKTFSEYPDYLDVYFPDGTLAPLDMWAVPRALRGETVNDAEYTLRRKNTGETWIGSYNFSPIRDKNGAIVGSVVVARDITEHKKQQLLLNADLDALTRMHELSSKLLVADDTQPLLDEIMYSAVVIVCAKFGTLQLLEDDSLRIVSHYGHRQPFLDFFASAENVASVCGEAMQRWERVVITDVETSPLFVGTPSLSVMRNAGVRAVQSTPMVSRAGKLLGILTTQWDVPYSPDEHDLWRIDLLARQAADLIELVKKGKELHESEERLRLLSNNLPDSALYQYVHELDGSVRFLYCSAGIEKLNGVSIQDVLHDPGTLHRQLSPEYLEQLVELEARSSRELSDFDMDVPMQLPNGQVRWMRLHSRPRRLPNGQTTWDSVQMDITKHKKAEQEREMTAEFLQLVNKSKGTVNLVHSAVNFFRERSGFEAVGIRLKDGDDYPYFETSGFCAEFVRLENSLCVKDTAGQIIRDIDGYPIHECMCGNVICRRFDSSKPFFTTRGSFCTNCTTELLATTTDADRQARTRNRCNGEGYESVALIALCVGEERLGLLQLNDRRKGQFTPETISMWERLTDYLAVAIAKAQAEESLQKAHENLHFQSKELQTQSEEIQSQNEELQAQSEEIQAQNKELQAKSKELNKAYETLQESEERFHTMANAIPQLAWIAQPDGYVYWYNERWYSYTGTTPEQMEGWGWQSVHDPEVLPQVLDQWKAALAMGQVFDMEFPLRGADGTFRQFLTRGFPLKDAAENVLQWFGTNTDITDRKKAEMALREIESNRRVTEAIETERLRFFKILETLPIMICLLTSDYHVNFANQSFKEKFGESYGRCCYDYCFGRTEPCEFCESYKVLETGQPHYWEVNFPDGSVIEAHDFPFTDVDGSPMILEMDIDVTESRKAEEKIRLSNVYNRSLIEASLDPLVTIGPDGKITDVNEATEQVTGYSRDELIGTDFTNYFTESVKAKEVYQEVFKEGLISDYELEIKHKDGSIIPVLYNASVYKDESGKVIGVFAAARDITTLKKAEEMLKLNLEELARSNEELEQFAYISSHDLQEPLRMITSYLQLLQRRYQGNLDDKADKYIHFAVDGASRMQNLINDLLEFSQVAKSTREPETVNSEFILNQVQSDLKVMIKEYKATISHDPLPDILVDSSQMIRLFQNLITNGIKFNRDDPPKIHVSAERKANEWVFSVQDNGIGIDPQYSERIFEIFKRLK
jgi:PAS domain S-box-containing protein